MITSRYRVDDMRTETTKEIKGSDGFYLKLHPGVSGRISQIWDNNNHNFKQKIEDGAIILSDCQIIRNERVVTEGHMHYTDGSWVRNDDGDLTQYLSGLESPMLSMGSFDMGPTTLIKAYAKMNSSKLMSGELVHDLSETIKMLKRPMASATDLVLRMRRYKKLHAGKTAKSITKAAADAWLEYRYGWRPIFMDIDNTIEIAHKLRDKGRKKILVARAGDSVGTTVTRHTPAHYAHPIVGCAGSSTLIFGKRCNAGVLYSVVETTKTETLQEQLGLRPRDVLPTVWECIPYSFVVDWFTNVGEWIQAITPNPRAEVLGNWITTITESSLSRQGYTSYPDPQPPEIGVFWGVLGGDVDTSFTFERTCNNQLQATPAVTAYLPSMLQAADAISLLVNPILGALKDLRH